MQELEIFEAQQRLKNRFNLPDYPKPCVTAIFELGTDSLRKEHALRIAVEYHRLGETDKRLALLLEDFNQRLSRPLRRSELQDVIKAALKDRYSYGCKDDILVAHCLGKRDCYYYKAIQKSRYAYLDYIRPGWLKKLTKTEFILIANLVPYLERRRGVWPGATLVVPYREIKNLSGFSLSTISRSLHFLASHGLLQLKPGEPMKGRAATEIARIVPVPDPANLPGCDTLSEKDSDAPRRSLSTTKKDFTPILSKPT